MKRASLQGQNVTKSTHSKLGSADFKLVITLIIGAMSAMGSVPPKFSRSQSNPSTPNVVCKESSPASMVLAKLGEAGDGSTLPAPPPSDSSTRRPRACRFDTIVLLSKQPLSGASHWFTTAPVASQPTNAKATCVYAGCSDFSNAVGSTADGHEGQQYPNSVMLATAGHSVANANPKDLILQVVSFCFSKCLCVHEESK